MINMIELLRKLIPYKVENIDLVRCGSFHDGGYVVPKNLLKTDACVSFGIADDVCYEEDILNYKKQPIYCFDPSIDEVPLKNVSNKDYIHFSKLGGIGKDLKEVIVHHRNTRKKIEHPFFCEGAFVCSIYQALAEIEHTWDFITLDEVFDIYTLRDKKVALKVDIEGSEFELFKGLQTDTLENVEYIVLEIHGLANEYFASQTDNLLDIILSKFTLVYAHQNNNENEFYLKSTSHIEYDDIYFGNVMELTFINNKHVEKKTLLDETKHPLDRACAWWFPENYVNYPSEIKKIDALKIDTNTIPFDIKEKKRSFDFKPILSEDAQKNTNNIADNKFKNTITQKIKNIILLIFYIPFGKIMLNHRTLNKKIDASNRDIENKISTMKQEMKQEIKQLQRKRNMQGVIIDLLFEFPDIAKLDIMKQEYYNLFGNDIFSYRLLNELKELIKKETLGEIVDLKCNVMTICIAKIIKEKGEGHVTCFTDDGTKARLIVSALQALGLSSYVTIRVKELAKFTCKEQNIEDTLWYDIKFEDVPHTINFLIFNDFEDIDKNASYLQLPLMNTYITDKTTILLHNMKDILHIAHSWSSNMKDTTEKIDRWIA